MSHKESYENFMNILTDAHVVSCNDNRDHCKDINKLIGFSISLQQKMMPIIKAQKDIRELASEHYIQNLFFLNLLSCYESELSTLKGLYIQAARHHRPVLESFPKISYLASHPNETLYVIAKDHVTGIRDNNEIIDKLNELKTSIFAPLFDGITMSVVRKKLIKKYTYPWYNTQVYSSDYKSTVEKYFHTISATMHANPNYYYYGYNGYNKEITNSDLIHIKSLLFLNIASVKNGWKNNSKQFPIEETKKLLEQYKGKCIRV